MSLPVCQNSSKEYQDILSKFIKLLNDFYKIIKDMSISLIIIWVLMEEVWYLGDL